MFTEEESPRVKLECIATYPLHDSVASMSAVSLNPRRDSLMLAFKDARLSVVEYDHNTHDLKTISLHYFETQDIRVGIIGLVVTSRHLLASSLHLLAASLHLLAASLHLLAASLHLLATPSTCWQR